MNFSKTRKSHAPAVQMSSLMDVVFLLLCFFVTSSVFSQWETEVAIALPTAKSATVPGRMPGEIILNLNEQGDVSINGQKLTLQDVTERLKRIAQLYCLKHLALVALEARSGIVHLEACHHTHIL